MADDDGFRGDRSHSGYVPTSPAMSSSPALELPVVPLDLRGPIEPPSFSAQGDLVPTVQTPSPFQPEFSPVLNVQNVDARQIHQQALFVNEDRSAQVAQIAELRHQAILAKHGQQVADEARQFRDAVANQARVAIEESREQHEAIANQRLSDMNQAHQTQQLHEQRAYLDRISLERHAVIESERASARQREDALRSELAEQSRIIKELRERFEVRQRLGEPSACAVSTATWISRVPSFASCESPYSLGEARERRKTGIVRTRPRRPTRFSFPSFPHLRSTEIGRSG